MASQITPSTWAGYNSYTPIFMSAVTSSGVYFNVGDAEKIIIFVANASSSDDGALYIVPGAQWSGSRGLAPSTTVSDFSTATAPIVCVAEVAVSTTVTTYIASTTGTFALWGPFEAATVKSSDNTIYVANSTVSTRMWISVMAMGSTN
jgi:hypothetical protein